jgi:anti-sigma regulatory factor (Ser/Thr protein kinase)
LEVLLRDDAPPFNPLRVPNPDLNAPLDKRKSGGLGIFLARKLTDRIIYRRLPDERNELKLVKLFPIPANQ